MRRSFNAQLLLRFAGLLLLIVLALLAQGAWIKQLVNDKVHRTRLATARDHYTVTLAELDQRWGREAFNLKTRIEAQDILGDSPQRHERVQTYLISQGSSIEFPSLRIERTNGELIAAYDYGSHANPKVKFMPSQVSAWTYNPDDRILHYANRQFVWLGKENGYLTLFKPMDHAMLTQMTYPGTRLSLWWKGRFIASSDGEEGLQRTAAAYGKPEDAPSAVVMSWSGPENDNTPRLLVEILPDELIGSDTLARPAAVLFLVLVAGILAAAYGLGSRIAAQFDALKMALHRYASLNRVDEQALAHLHTARAGPHESGREVAEALEKHLQAASDQAGRPPNLPLFHPDGEH